MSITVQIRRLANGHGLPLPAYATEGAAGMDLSAAVESEVILAPGARLLVPTGFSIALPPGYEAQLRPRSGLAFKHGVTVLNAPGTIDWDYRGELKALLVNHGEAPFIIERGLRIAQLVIAPVSKAVLSEVADLDTTERGAGGYGSTGGFEKK